MSRLSKLIAELCPDGVEYRALGEVGQFLRGSSFQKKHFTEAGMPCIHYGQVHTQFGVSTNRVVSFLDESFAVRMKRAQQGNLIIATTSEDDEAVGKATAWMGDFDVVVSNDAFIYRHTLDPMYVSYFFASDQFQQAKMPLITGAKVRRLSRDDMSKIRIPVPPIEVQREIVRILDSFQELDDALTAEIEAREKQLQSLIDMMLGLEDVTRIHGESVMLSSLCNSIFDGDHQPPPQASDGIPFVVIADFNKGEVDFSNTKYVGSDYYDGLKAVRKPVKGDVILSVTGSYGISALVTSDQPFCFQRHVALLKPKCNSVFLLALMRSGYARRYFDMNVTGAVQKQISLTALRKMPVPVISEAQQEAIATKTWVMGTMISAIRSERDARRKQFAYYRDKLLAFPELNKEVDE